MRWLAVTFLLVPLLELWLLLRVGDVIGFWPTFGLVIGAALLGSWLAKREGLSVLRSWQGALTEMRMPEEGITSGLLVLVGAVLLITPGVLTDIVGLALLVPISRRWVARRLERHLPQFVMPFGAGMGRNTAGVSSAGRTAQGPYSSQGPVAFGARGSVLDVEGQPLE